MQNRKFLVEFEALRGIAAVVVLIHHFMLGFTPRLHGLLYPEQPYSLMGTPAFAFINGSAAVVIFFVLSGFVLTVRLFSRPDLMMAVVTAAKRWPRLAGTVIAANLIAGAFMGVGLFQNVKVATLVPSIWLGWFYAWSSTGIAEIPSAMLEGATTFFTGKAKFNSNLWTMYYEFWGSMIAILCAAICSVIRPRNIQSAFLAGIWAAVFCFDAYMSTFVMGVWLARNYVARPHLSWSGWPVYALIVLAVILAGYHENLASGRPEGIYRALAPLTALDTLRVRVVLHSVAAVIMMLLFVRVGFIRNTVSGAVGRTLGFLSFAIYLAQIVVIASFSAMTFAALLNAPHVVRILATFVVTVVGTILIAIPLAFFDRWWVGTLNRIIRSLSFGQDGVAYERFKPGKRSPI